MSEAIKKEGAKHLTELDFTNTNFESKAAMYIGEALISNPTYPVKKIFFANLKIEEYGLLRVLEAINANKNIEKLHVGYVTDVGLNLMTE